MTTSVTYRRKPEVTGDNVFLPESWPPEQREADAEHSTIAISADAAGLQDVRVIYFTLCL